MVVTLFRMLILSRLEQYWNAYFSMVYNWLNPDKYRDYYIILLSAIQEPTIMPNTFSALFNSFLFRGLFDFFVEKVIDDNGRRVERSSHAVVVADIFKAFLFTKGRKLFVERAPIGAAVPAVDVVIERHKVGMFLRDIFQDEGLIVAA